MNEQKFKEALSKAEHYCAAAERAPLDIINKLKQWEVEPQFYDEILDLLQKTNFYNPQRYAVAFARDKFRFNKWGKSKIALELKYKGIDESVIYNVLTDEFQEGNYLEELKSLIEKKAPSVKAKNKYEYRAKIYRYALSKGFSSGDINRVLGEMDV